MRKFLRRFRRKRRMVTISAVVTRADGTVEDLGVISSGPIKYTAKGEARAR